MPLYELELRELGEVRLTDQVVEVGELVTIASRDWLVESRGDAVSAFAAARFRCREIRRVRGPRPLVREPPRGSAANRLR